MTRRGRAGDAGHVAVIGAGLAGLAAALHLHRAGVPVRIYDAADAVGGQVRSDQVDGFTLDRGFQVHNTSYPEATRLLDVPALRLRPFLRAALLSTPDGSALLVDPRETPSAASGLIHVSSLSWKDRLLLTRFGAKLWAATPGWLLREPETTTVAYLRGYGFSPAAIDTLFRPFLSGVFLERELVTSSRFFLMVFRAFVRGHSTLPESGIAAIPKQLAAMLPSEALHLGERLDGLPPDAESVVVATDPDTAHRLLPGLGPAPATTSVTTYYHRTAEPPDLRPVIRLDSTGRTAIANTTVLSATVPTYAPLGWHLISTSVVGEEIPEPAVRQQLRQFYGPHTETFEPLSVVHVPNATPLSPPPLGDLRREVRVRPGVYVAGAHRDSPSTQGALVSGRRAATALLAEWKR